MTEEKYICIKSFKDIEGETEVGKKYLLVKSGIYSEIYYIILGVDEHGIWIFGPGILKSTIPKYFITLSEWRDKQINSILND
jgi:hypothetical protein